MEKYSKQLKGKKMLWAFYKEDPKGAKNFEEYCKVIVDIKNKALANVQAFRIN